MKFKVIKDYTHALRPRRVVVQLLSDSGEVLDAMRCFETRIFLRRRIARKQRKMLKLQAILQEMSK